ncbi:zinc ribbon domain-containing protein [Lactobacillus sp. ESL0791]|uniref:zinc ribbon domain-containing protein n=1 Tax=Lactobacillus sp. ESL0791 TaxID=2983234 RepID=UPI0023F738BA|nr:zinc ribbon domain-containing protein [Lactobacillus sp. ESL0791]MDF7639545.1 zinc ribbon domain-containing protein [Lactobacillus sp. ESL0791]
MKKCPKCGSLMESSVNFCTNCGTDIRNVVVEKETSTDNASFKAQETVSRENIQQVSSSTPSAWSSYWQWFVESWKHPFAEQDGENWYGWVTLVAESFLLVIGLYVCMSNSVHQYFGRFTEEMPSLSGLSFSATIELFFLLVLLEAALLGAGYLAYMFIYNKIRSFWSFTNHVVQSANLNAIFTVLAFLMLLMGASSSSLAFLLLLLIFIIFIGALYVVILGDPKPARDKMYGLLIFIGLVLVVSIVWGNIAYNTVLAPITSFFNDVWRMM